MLSRTALFIAVLSASLSISAQTALQPEQRKYCGSGFTEKLVPEAPFGCQMSGACKAHDACYGKCDEDGSMFGKPYCTKSEFSAIRMKARLACEMSFYQDIDKHNDGRWVCKGLGALYVAAVAVVGQGPYNGRQMPLASMEDLILTSNTVDEIKLKTTTIAGLSQKGLVDLQQMSRVQDRIEFAPIFRGGISAPQKFEFTKGIDVKELKRMQLEKLSK